MRAGDTMTGSLLFSSPLDPSIYLGCTNLGNTKSLNVVLGSLNNQIEFVRNDANQSPLHLNK